MEAQIWKAYFVTTNFEFGCIESGVLVCWTLHEAELALICCNGIVDIQGQLD